MTLILIRIRHILPSIIFWQNFFKNKANQKQILFFYRIFYFKNFIFFSHLNHLFTVYFKTVTMYL